MLGEAPNSSKATRLGFLDCKVATVSIPRILPGSAQSDPGSQSCFPLSIGKFGQVSYAAEIPFASLQETGSNASRSARLIAALRTFGTARQTVPLRVCGRTKSFGQVVAITCLGATPEWRRFRALSSSQWPEDSYLHGVTHGLQGRISNRANEGRPASSAHAEHDGSIR